MSVEERDVAKLPSGRDDAVPVVETSNNILRRPPRRPRPRSLPESSRVPAFVSSLLLLPTPLVRPDLGRGHPYFRRWTPAQARSYSRRGMAGSGRDERAWVRRAQAGSASDFEALFRRTGAAPIAPPTWSSATRPPPRTSPRRRSSPRSAPRPLRPAPAVRTLAAPDRRQPGDRLGARPRAAARGGAVGRPAPEPPERDDELLARTRRGSRRSTGR